jgi:hypothetical protein
VGAFATGGVAFALLLAALTLSPYRYFLVPVALVVFMAFTRLRAPDLALLAIVPYVVLANLEGWLTDTSLYPSEVILLTAVGVVALRRRQAIAWQGAALLALAFAAWMIVAALAGAATTDSARVAKLIRSAFLGASLFALGFAAARRPRGAATWIDAATGAAGLFGFLAVGEAVFGLRHGVPRAGSVVGGSELLAIHLTLLAPPAIALVALGVDRSRATKALLVLSGLALVVSFSRSGWVGGWAAILGMGLVASKLDRRRGAGLLLLAGLGLGLAILAALVLTATGETLGAYAARLRSLLSADLLADRRSDWQSGLATVRAHPIFGLPDARNPYNILLGLAAVSGLPILVLFATLIGIGVRSGLRALRESRSAAAPVAVGLFGSVIGLLVTGIGEASLGTRLTPPVMVTLGLLAGLGAGTASASRPAAGPGSSPLPSGAGAR